MQLEYLLVGLFLPLFPFSIVLNAALQRVNHPLLRSVLILAWPQAGLLLLSLFNGDPPSWLVYWALATSVLYAFRLLAMRELKRWTIFLGTSAWAILWLPAATGADQSLLWQYAAAFSVPLVLLTLLTSALEQRFGAAYSGLYGGIALSTPRFAGVLVVSVLAATATPLFPSFFAMLGAGITAEPLPAFIVAFAWLIWSWAAARMLQGLIVGAADPSPDLDLNMATTWVYSLGLLALVVAGLILTGSAL